jgi:hypothetical protein
MKNWTIALSAAVIICALTAPARAGDACKGVRVTEDPFGGGASMKILIQAMTGYTPVGMELLLGDGTVELQIFVKEYGMTDAVFPAGTEVPALFDDGEVVQLTFSRDSTVKVWDCGGVCTSLGYFFEPDAALLRRMGEHTIRSIRLPGSTDNHDWKIPKPTQKKLQKTAACAATHVTSEEPEETPSEPDTKAAAAVQERGAPLSAEIQERNPWGRAALQAE